MNIRLASPVAHARRARANVTALLALSALLLLLLGGVGIVRWRAAQPVVAAPQVASAPPVWHADLLTAYHAARYLLDPRV
jgi:hypothetical protein